MATQLSTNFSLKNTQYLDNRKEFASIRDMKAFPETQLPKVFYAIINTTEYRYCVDNPIDADLGRWRVYDPASEVDLSGEPNSVEATTDSTPPDSDKVIVWMDYTDDTEEIDRIEGTFLEEIRSLFQQQAAQIDALSTRVLSLESEVVELRQLINSGGGGSGDGGTTDTTYLMMFEDGQIMTFEDGTEMSFEHEEEDTTNVMVFEDGQVMIFEDGQIMTFESSGSVTPTPTEDTTYAMTFEDATIMKFEDNETMTMER